MEKKASILNEVLVQLILIAVVILVFFMAVSGRATGRGVKQQVAEKEIALLIDAAVPTTRFEIFKKSPYGVIQKIDVSKGRVKVWVDGLASFKGYPYYTRFDVSVEEKKDRFLIWIR